MPAAIYTQMGLTKQEFRKRLCRLYEDGYSQAKIAKMLSCDRTVVERWFGKLGIPTRSIREAHRIRHERHVMLDERHCEVFDGLMLSDLHVEPGRWQSRVSFGFKHLEFAQHVISSLPFQWGKLNKSTKTGCWHAKTLACYELLRERKRWYKGRTKVVPVDVRITPTSLLWWYLGDGRVEDYGLSLCSESFSPQENGQLVEKIRSLGIPCHVTPANRIRVEKASGVKVFARIVPPCPVSCYVYKWRFRIKQIGGEWI